MDLDTTMFLALVALIACNQLVARVPVFRDHPAVFWGMQFTDVAAGTAVLIFGLPGFGHFPPVRYVVGLMFFLHIATNLQLRARADRLRVEEARRQRRQ